MRLLPFIFLVACASSGARHVRVFDIGQPAPANCQNLGWIRASSGLFGDNSREEAIANGKKQVAELGGNVFEIKTDEDKGPLEVKGNALRCP